MYVMQYQRIAVININHAYYNKKNLSGSKRHFIQTSDTFLHRGRRPRCVNMSGSIPIGSDKKRVLGIWSIPVARLFSCHLWYNNAI